MTKKENTGSKSHETRGAFAQDSVNGIVNMMPVTVKSEQKSVQLEQKPVTKPTNPPAQDN